MLFDLKRKAIQTIRHAVKLKNFENIDLIIDDHDKIKYIKVLDQFKSNLSDFRTARKFVISKEHEISALNILYNIHENVSVEMEEIIMNANDQMNSLVECLELSQTIQDEIKDYTDKLDKMTKVLDDCLHNEIK
jgi:hypothetical protein